MSFDDNHRNQDRERGAYTPPTDDDDLPFRRNAFDPRQERGYATGARKAPPVTLIVSAAVLLLLIVAVIFFYRSGLRSSTDAPPAVGQPVGEMTTPAPLEAQPVDPAEGVRVYRDETEAADAAPTFTAPPETPQARPAAPAPAPVTGEGLPPAATPAPARPAPARPTETAPRPASAPAPAEKAAPASAAATGSSGVQIGAFSSTAIADREYAAVAARFGSYASGAQKRVQEVTASNGSTVYRTTFSGLSRERATAFCNALKAAGRDCIVR